MNNTAWLSIDNKEHADMDDTGDWSVDNPITQRAHRALPQCSGACEQGRRDCSCPTGRPQPAEACTEVGAEDQFESADGEVVLWLLKGLAVVLVAIASAWVIAGLPSEQKGNCVMNGNVRICVVDKTK